jgi:hypothetical protein
MYVIKLSEPARQYSPAVRFLRKGDPVGMDTNTTTRAAECAPCAGSNLTLKEKLISLDDMELMEENEDDSPATDYEESVAYVCTNTV